MISARYILLLSLLIPALPAATFSAAAGGGNADDLRQAKAWNDSADQYMDRGLYDEARHLYLRSLPVLEKALGPENPTTIATLANLCVASGSMARYLDAKPLCTRALAVREKVFGPNHPDVARSLSDLGLLYAKEGDLARAESMLRRAFQIDSAYADSPDMAKLYNNLGFLCFQKKKYSQAEDWFERAIVSTTKTRGADDPDLVTMLGNAGTVYLADRRFAAAEKRFRQALTTAERAFGPEQAASLQARIGLARAEAAQGNGSEAENDLHRAQGVMERDRGTYLQWRSALEAARFDLARR